MNFRPCIDIHNGAVKQIVGGSLKDEGNFAAENFVSKQDAGFYARLYKKYNLFGGHIILLNPCGTPEYKADLEQAKLAFKEFEGGLQIGGGITDQNCKDFIEMGASHVIVTSYVFKNGTINFDNLNKLIKLVGKERLVLDLSCRKKGKDYYIVTDRWQKFTETKLDKNALEQLSGFCSEFLIHAVDSEGKAKGIESGVAELLANSPIKAVYAGGISSFEDLKTLEELSCSKADFTIGSALDIFGGNLPFEQAALYSKL